MAAPFSRLLTSCARRVAAVRTPLSERCLCVMCLLSLSFNCSFLFYFDIYSIYIFIYIYTLLYVTTFCSFPFIFPTLSTSHRTQPLSLVSLSLPLFTCIQSLFLSTVHSFFGILQPSCCAVRSFILILLVRPHVLHCFFPISGGRLHCTSCYMDCAFCAHSVHISSSAECANAHT